MKLRSRAGVGVLFLIATISVTYVVLRFGVIRAPSASMEPTIHEGALLLIDRFAYAAGPPRRGDIVAFTGLGPFLPVLVDRVVAVPGDRFAIHGGRAIVNGRRADGAHEPDARYDLSIADYDIIVDGKRLGELDVLTVSDWAAPDRVPPGCYLVLGDNRNNPLDSHSLGFLCPDRAGLMSRTDPIRLIGRVLRR